MIFGIFIGIVVSIVFVKARAMVDKDVIVTKRYYGYSSTAYEAYNAISQYFNEHDDKLQLVSMKMKTFPVTTDYCVVVKYKKLDNDFKVKF